MKQDHTYEIDIDITFSPTDWHVVNMLMDYCNNLGLMKESLLKVDLQGKKITLTTVSEDEQ